MLIDITDTLLPSLTTRLVQAAVAKERADMAPSRHPQAALMFAKLAAHRSDNLGTFEDEYRDFSHAMNFWALRRA